MAGSGKSEVARLFLKKADIFRIRFGDVNKPDIFRSCPNGVWPAE